jgi:hypothetical protein
MWYEWGKGEVRTGFLWVNPREIDNLEDIGIVEKRKEGITIDLKSIGMAWTGLIWLTMCTGGWLLQTRGIS